MKNTITIIQIILSVALIVLVMIQPKGNKSFTRRGVERLIYRLTYIVSALFLLSAIVMLVA